MFGSAAAVAVASLPLAGKGVISPPFVTPVAALQRFKKRLVFDLTAEFDASCDGMATVDLSVNDRRPLLHFAVNQRSTRILRWVVCRDDEAIMILENDTLLLDLKSQSGLGRVSMVCKDFIDDSGYPMEVYEEHVFPARGPALILPLHVDNSLEARRMRAEQRPNPDPEYAPEDDEADLWDS